MQPRDCLVFEDSRSGIKAGNAAGVAAVVGIRSELSDAALGLDLGGNGGLGSLGGGLGSLGSALGAPPPLSRRSSRNVDSPSRH